MAVFSQAKPPAEVAELVLAAVLEQRFWVETDTVFRDPIRARNRSIEEGSEPPASGTILDAYL